MRKKRQSNTFCWKTLGHSRVEIRRAYGGAQNSNAGIQRCVERHHGRSVQKRDNQEPTQPPNADQQARSYASNSDDKLLIFERVPASMVATARRTKNIPEPGVTSESLWHGIDRLPTLIDWMVARSESGFCPSELLIYLFVYPYTCIYLHVRYAFICATRLPAQIALPSTSGK